MTVVWGCCTKTRFVIVPAAGMMYFAETLALPAKLAATAMARTVCDVESVPGRLNGDM